MLHQVELNFSFELNSTWYMMNQLQYNSLTAFCFNKQKKFYLKNSEFNNQVKYFFYNFAHTHSFIDNTLKHCMDYIHLHHSMNVSIIHFHKQMRTGMFCHTIMAVTHTDHILVYININLERLYSRKDIYHMHYSVFAYILSYLPLQVYNRRYIHCNTISS